VNGWLSPVRRPLASVSSRLAPIPPGPSRRIVVESPSVAPCNTGASRTKVDSRPTNRALENPAGIAAF